MVAYLTLDSRYRFPGGRLLQGAMSAETFLHLPPLALGDTTAGLAGNSFFPATTLTFRSIALLPLPAPLNAFFSFPFSYLPIFP